MEYIYIYKWFNSPLKQKNANKTHTKQKHKQLYENTNSKEFKRYLFYNDYETSYTT